MRVGNIIMRERFQRVWNDFGTSMVELEYSLADRLLLDRLELLGAFGGCESLLHTESALRPVRIRER